MSENIYAVVMAGGSGERFWPLSTNERPKQFVKIFGGKALLGHAVDRLEGLVPPERVLVVTSRALTAATAEACPRLPPENIVGEPCRRDTAAAAALACGLVAARDPNGVALLLSADHLMEDESLFRQTLADAAAVAGKGDYIVTIGIAPTFPATGYGYIEAGELFDAGTGTEFHFARRFVEKPDAEHARQYLSAGNFFWNSGMFVWSAKTMAKAVAEFTPSLLPVLRAPAEAASPEALDAALDAIYPSLERISVDYAIMEKHPGVIMARGAFGWDDVGSWSAIPKHFPQDACGNTPIGNVELMDSRGCIVLSDDGSPVAVLGAEDLIVVRTGGATLVCAKDRAQDLKALVAKMTRRGGAPT